MSNEPTVATLWGGIGGGMLGFVQAGYQALWAADDRDFVRKKWFGQSWLHWITHSNIKALTPGFLDPKVVEDSARRNYQPIVPDVIVGSPPCKRFSSLAVRKKDRLEFDPDDLEYVRFAKTIYDIRPKAFVLENLVSIQKHLFWTRGNDTAGHLHQAPTLTLAADQTVLVRLHGYTLEAFELNAVDYGVPQNRKRLYIVGVKNDCLQGRSIMRPHVVRDPPHTVEEAFEGLTPRVWNMDLPKHSAERKAGFTRLEPGQSYYGTQNNRRIFWDRPGPTVTSHRTQYVHPSEPRTLTVRECARLMGFPDGFHFYGPRTKQLDQVGCGICPPVLLEIATVLKGLL